MDCGRQPKAPGADDQDVLRHGGGGLVPTAQVVVLVTWSLVAIYRIVIELGCLRQVPRTSAPKTGPRTPFRVAAGRNRTNYKSCQYCQLPYED